MKPSLVVFGVALIVGMAFFANILVTPETKFYMREAPEFLSSPMGNLVKNLAGDVTTMSQDFNLISRVLSFETPAYIFGIFLVVSGLLMGKWRRPIIDSGLVAHVLGEKEKTQEASEVQ